VTDIDIDVMQRSRVTDGLGAVPAALATRQPHASGLYFQDIPFDPLDGLAVWDYQRAAGLGYFKIDLLSCNLYEGVRDEEHLVDLLTREPPWHALDDPAVVNKLAHVNGHFAEMQAIRPRSIEDLAVCLAIIRPGKRYLLGRSRAEIDREIWIRNDADERFSFKRSHSIAYAAAIVVQLNLLNERHHLSSSADPADQRAG